MTPTTTTPLPAPPDGWFAYRYCLLSDGTLAVVWADRDINAEYRAWYSMARKRAPDQSRCQAQLAVISGTGASQPITLPAAYYTKIDRFPDGRWLIVTPRTRGDQENAMILNETGSQFATFCLGDGIQHVRCAGDGTIWVGYFDEGVFGDSVGAGGLVHFSAEGRQLGAYNAAEKLPALWIADCYALTIVGSDIWTCFYSDFPIVRLRDGRQTHWHNDVCGAKALAVDGRHVVLAGGYRGDATRLHLLRLGEGTADLIGSVPCSQLEDADLVAGRGATINVVKDGIWSQFSVSDVRSCFT
jgi:hypothetical protein